MPQFSRGTILAASDLITAFSHSALTRFLLEYGLENEASVGSLRDRATALARHLLQAPDELDDEGRCLTDTVVAGFVERAIAQCARGFVPRFDNALFQQTYPALDHALRRDGFTVDSGQLRRALPETLDLPRADDEVHALLDAFAFGTSKGHLDQAIAAHARGEWAAANGQLRSFVESLLDSAADRLSGGATVPLTAHQRQQWLARTPPPFFLADLNEWSGQGTGFIEAFFRRLHPSGPHPGLSDEEDSTFRLHLVLLVARLLLRRLGARAG